jgi:hypothetical protein
MYVSKVSCHQALSTVVCNLELQVLGQLASHTCRIVVLLGLRFFGRTLANDTKLSSFVRGVFFPTPHAHGHQLLGLRFLSAASHSMPLFGLVLEKHPSHLGSVTIGVTNCIIKSISEVRC